MGSDPVRVALLGYGLAGSVFHAPLIAATDGLQIVAIVTRDAERREAAASRHPGARLVDDLDAALDLEPELVVVATPNVSHAPLAQAALERGANVVVEKPLAATTADAESLVELAAAQGVMLTVFQNRRWDGDLLTVRRLVNEGTLGTVGRFESRFERWRPVVGDGWREGGSPEQAGGLLADLGSHLIDQSLHLFGDVVSVYAELDSRRAGSVVDDDSFVALTHANGVRSHLWMSAVAAEPGPRFRVLGSEGSFVKYGLDGQEAALRAGGVPGEPGWGEEPEADRGSVTTGDGTRAVRTEHGAYEEFYAGVRAALREGARPPVDPRGVISALRVIDAARQSSAGGVIVQLQQQH